MFPVTPKKEAQLRQSMKAMGIKESDLKESFVRGTGRGGQKKNKSSVCVLLSHEASGLKVRVDQERSQALNRFFARRQLVEALEKKRLGAEAPASKKAEKIRKQKIRRKRRAASNKPDTKIIENKAFPKKSAAKKQ